MLRMLNEKYHGTFRPLFKYMYSNSHPYFMKGCFRKVVISCDSVSGVDQAPNIVPLFFVSMDNLSYLCGSNCCRP